MQKNNALITLRYYRQVLYAAVFVLVFLIMVALISPVALLATIPACLASMFATALFFYQRSTKLPYPEEQHLFHVVHNSLTQLSHDPTVDMTPLVIARTIATELVYEGLVTMDDFENVKTSLLEMLDENEYDEEMQMYRIEGQDVIDVLVPHVTSPYFLS